MKSEKETRSIKEQLLNAGVYFTIFKIKAKNTSGAYVKEQKFPFEWWYFRPINNLRNPNLKYVNFESKSSKIGKKWSVTGKILII